jgi:nucleoside-diphosphate-sugar epimerase
MKALVTGATGFIGGALASALSAAGWEVHVLVRPSSLPMLPPASGWQVHLGDLTDPGADFSSAMHEVDVVFHAAAIRDRWGTSSLDYLQANVEGTRRLLHAAKGQVGRFVYVSSVGVHGYPRVQGIDESFPLRPADGKPGYHGAKAQAEQVVFSSLADSRTEAVVARPTITYGPGDRDGMVTRLLLLLSKGMFIRIGRGANHLHLTYIDDMARGLMLAGTVPQAAGEAFILAGPKTTAFADLVGESLRALRQEAVVGRAWLAGLWLPEGMARMAASLVERAWRQLDWSSPPLTCDQIDTICIHRGFSYQKAAQRLGYQPLIREQEGLARTVGWLVEQGKLPAAARMQHSVPAPSNEAR